MREVEGQVIGRTRSAGNCYTSSVIWGTVCIGKPTHLGFICTHLDVGGDVRGRNVTRRRYERTEERLGLASITIVFSIWGLRTSVDERL